MDEEMDELLRELVHIQDRLRFLDEDFEAAKTAEERMVILGRKLPLNWRLGEITKAMRKLNHAARKEQRKC